MSDFYTLLHDGHSLTLPRVTSILRIIDKSGPLMGWAVKVERESIRGALEEVLTQPGEITPHEVWERMTKTMQGRRASWKAQNDAADIGKAAHAIIHWHTLRMLGQDAGPEPSGPDAALRAVMAWLDWVKEVDFQPQLVERLVYCPWCGYAGTLDTVGKVQGQLTLVDYKTGKAVYDEAHLQVCAYKHALDREGIVTDGALILRLPKTAADPDFQPVPAMTIPLKYFLYARGLWHWQRTMQHEDTGNVTMGPCKVGR